MKTYNKRGTEIKVVNNIMREHDFKIGSLTSNNVDDIFFDIDNKKTCGIKYGIFNYNEKTNTGLIGFYNAWICTQIKIEGNSTLYLRFKYGDEPWSEWKQII